MRYFIFSTFGYGVYYVFNYIVDYRKVPIEGWVALACITIIVTIAAGHISLPRVAKALFRSMRPTRYSPANDMNMRLHKSIPTGNGVGDWIKLKMGEAQENLLRTKAEETRKTEEVKRQAILNAEARRAEAHALRTQAKTPAVPDAPAIVVPPITLREAIAQSTERNWIMGQESEFQGDTKYTATGKLLTFDYQTNHAAIIGATGGGKTEGTAFLMVHYARKFGLHVIVLDGKQGIDWERYDGAVEWHDMNIATIEHQMDSLTKIFTQRFAELKQAKVGKIYDLPGKRKRPIMVILEEFGQLWSVLEQKKHTTLKEKLEGQLDNLFRLGRAAGFIIVLIDQAPEGWSKQMRGNAKFVACYKLNGNVANVFNEYHSGKLPDKGVFTQANVFYSAWHYAGEMDLGRSCPPIKARYIREQVVNNTMNGLFTNVHSERSMNTNEQPVNGDLLKMNGVNGMNVHERAEGGLVPNQPVNTEYTPSPEVANAFMNTGNWDEVVTEFRHHNPTGGPSDLARVMAKVANDGRAYNNFKSRAASLLSNAQRVTV